MAKRAQLSEAERADWLRLIRSDSVGPITFRRLLQRYGSAADALDALPDLAARSGRKRPLKAPPKAAIARELEAAAAIGARFIALCEPDYPMRLAAIDDAPPVLCVHGHAQLFEPQAVAIVGARNASAIGRKIARTIAAALGEAGVVIVSGLARGVDGAAHEAALPSGTLAVVAGGVDHIYPPEHAELHQRIAEIGAVIAERPMGYAPQARDFPRRNRLISGLSQGVLVVEAAARSGTLITARYALEQGRDVYAVPGSPLDPRCQGTNGLIRDGAMLVQSADDILESLAADAVVREDPEDANDLLGFAAEPRELDPQAVAELRAEVLDLLTAAPIHRDELLRETGASPSQLADALLTLVLADDADEIPGGSFVRRY